MTGDEHSHLYERLEKRIDLLEADLRELRDKDVRKLEDFKKMVQISLLTVFVVVTYISSEGWEMLKRLFVR